MKHGQISENKSINEAIYECFQHLENADVERFVSEFRSQPHDEHQVLHTFRELVLGSYLARNGFRVRAYQKYGGREPDWSILGQGGELLALIDIVNFHAGQKTETYVHKTLAEGKVAAPEIDEEANSLRFYQSVKKKCTVYHDLIESRNIPYVIGFFPQFEIVVDRFQIMENLYSGDSGLFRSGDDGGYPNVSGLVNYPDLTLPDSPNSVAHAYRFEYFPNPYARRPFAFPSGNYYPPMLISSAPNYKHLLSIAAALDSLIGQNSPDVQQLCNIMRLWFT